MEVIASTWCKTIKSTWRKNCHYAPHLDHFLPASTHTGVTWEYTLCIAHEYLIVEGGGCRSSVFILLKEENFVAVVIPTVYTSGKIISMK